MTWNKPLPQATTISAPYWDGLKQHEVRIQQCEEHGHWLFFPRTHCPTCGSRRLAWRHVSGEGTLYTYTVARVPTLPEFSDEMPQLLAVVELDEGVHINTTLVGVDPAALAVGMRVRPVFDERPGVTTLLRYTPVDSAHPGVMANATADAEAPAPEAAPQAEAAKRQIGHKDLETLRALVSDSYSDWSNAVQVTQDMINQFAALSGDDYWIHTDPERAKRDGPFGGTIAHGALVQVLASRLKMPMDFEVVGFTNIVNYGSDRLRFPSPVPAGCRIHGRYRIKAVEAVKSGTQLTMEINIHVVGQDRPSVINDLVMLYM
jgi:uncharacterized OB-fold protein/acyl dehydratase